MPTAPNAASLLPWQGFFYLTMRCSIGRTVYRQRGKAGENQQSNDPQNGSVNYSVSHVAINGIIAA
jgi:hypothetical protein